MQDLLKFIVKYSNLLVFLILEVVAFLLLGRYNEFPKSSYMSSANSLVAKQYEITDALSSYFSLRHMNNLLQEENSELRNQLEMLRSFREDSLTEAAVSYAKNSKDGIRYIPARVIQTETRLSHNYLTINRGSLAGVEAGMGVRCPEGVVGIVAKVSEDYAIVIPIIHTQSHTSCAFLKNDYYGTLSWDGDNYHIAQLEDVAIHMDVQVGDTLVTSGVTVAFPKGIPVGIVEKCKLGDGDSYFTIDVQLSTDFRRLGYVQVIDNRSAQQINELRNGLD